MFEIIVGSRVLVPFPFENDSYTLGTVREIYGATCSVKTDAPFVLDGLPCDGIFCRCDHLVPVVEVVNVTL